MESGTPSTPQESAKPERLAYKPTDAAAALGISRARVFELMRDGSLHSVRYGRTRLIPKLAIERFLEVEEAA